ncbi:MAG TPA: GPW/gp25 family protein [Geminicoccaceae bacterium]|nr:GPW/gp25 family protein [Geminicoccaceae bacterium]
MTALPAVRANRRLPPEPLSFPLLPLPEAGRLAFPDLARSVREALRVILLTRPGELLLHPAFGVGLEDFLDQPATLATRRRIQDAVAAGIARFERRILLDRVEVQEVAGRPEALRLEIAYRLRRTGEPGALGLTLTLGG